MLPSPGFITVFSTRFGDFERVEQSALFFIKIFIRGYLRGLAGLFDRTWQVACPLIIADGLFSVSGCRIPLQKSPFVFV